MAGGDCMTHEVCDIIKQMHDERFARDERRITDTEKTLQEVVQLNVKYGAMLEQQAKELNEHDSRIDKIESSDSKWLDQIKIWVGAAIITAVMNLVLTSVGL